MRDVPCFVQYTVILPYLRSCDLNPTCGFLSVLAGLSIFVGVGLLEW